MRTPRAALVESTAVDPSSTVPDRKRTGPRPKLTGEDMLLIARLHSAGRSLRAIAATISTPDRSVSAETVGHWLRRAKQPQEHFHMTLAAGRLDAVEAWHLAMKRGARDGRHAPAKDWLVATGTVRPDERPSLVVVIGSGTADVDALPVLPARPALVSATPAETP